MKRDLSFSRGSYSSLIAVIFIIGLITWLNSCKKKDAVASDKENRTTRNIPADILEKFRNTPRTISLPGEGPVTPAIVVDRNGDVITPGQINSLNNVMACDPNDPGWVDNTFFVKNQKITFGCATAFNGFQVKAQIVLTTGFLPQTLDPVTMTLHSRVSMRIREVGTGTLLYTVGDVDLTMGTDITYNGPGFNPDLTLWDINYVSPMITSISSPAGVYFEYKPYIYTDCQYAAITVGPSWLKFTTSDLYSNPCKRLDWVDISTGGMGNPGWAYFDGSNAMFCYPGGFNPPEQHWIDWYKPGTSAYGTAAAPTQLQFTGFCTGPVDLPSSGGAVGYNFPTTGLLKVRFRNMKQTSTNPCTATNTCYGPYSDWFDLTIY